LVPLIKVSPPRRNAHTLTAASTRQIISITGRPMNRASNVVMR